MNNMTIGDFEGPLDLLLHLIKKNKMEIFDIEISLITKEYLDFISKSKDLNLDVSSEYLVLASELIEIKSKKLLPRKDEEEKEEDIDAEEELKRRLYEYKKYKENTEVFRKLEEKRNNYYTKAPEALNNFKSYKLENDGSVNVEDLLNAFEKLLERQRYNKPVNTKITKKELSVKDRIITIRNMLTTNKRVVFTELFDFYVSYMSVESIISNGYTDVVEEQKSYYLILIIIIFVLLISLITILYSKIKKMSGQMNRTKNILVGCILLVLFPRDGFVSIFKK